MKKLFFFRSSSSSGSNNNKSSPTSTHEQGYLDIQPDGGEKSRNKKQVPENNTATNAPFLRRSRSSSSAAIFDGGNGRRRSGMDQPESPLSTSNSSLKQLGRHSSRHAMTPERQYPSKCSEVAGFQAARRTDRRGSVPSPGLQYDSSDCSSYSSSNVSTAVLDRYIDGEQQQEKSASQRKFSSINDIEFGNDLIEQAPICQFNGSTSPNIGRKQKPKSQSFREIDAAELHFSSRDWVDGGFGNESPRKLAKHVVERLSQSKFLPKKTSRESDSDIPITVEDIYSGTLNRSPCGDSGRIALKNSPGDESKDFSDGYLYEDTTGFAERNSFSTDNCEFMNSNESAVDVDQKLFRQFKEAEEQALLFSEELEQKNFRHQSELSLSSMVQNVRGLSIERANMAYEIATILKNWITDRASLRKELNVAREELESKTRKLEKEKNELQSALERELDRRSNEWSLKLEKYQSEEHRLRERVRELAEQNVSLQREISSFSESETGLRNRVSYFEQQVVDLTAKVEEVKGENKNLQQDLAEMQEKYRAAEEDRDCLRRNYEDKAKECKDLHRSVTRLQRTCGEQEKSIDGLRSLCEEIQNNNSTEKNSSHLGKLQMEQVRLTGLEYALRKEVESLRMEVDSLRHENINLLNRLKETGKDGGFSTFKLDQELWNRICCLQNQGLSFLADSSQLCRNLLEYIKTNRSHNAKAGLGVDSMGLDSQFIVESEVKLQGFNRGFENLTKSLSVVSTVQHEKATVQLEKSQPSVTPQCSIAGVESSHLNHKKSEDVILSELKAESLMTALLKEKLHSKELEIEQYQAELAAAVRGNDILKSEVQNALDTLSCASHRMKDLELQIMKKDENINQLQHELQECTKELTIVKGILPKVSEERDMMWSEVKQYSEKTMLLNCEMNMLKKKIEALDEDILLKEGQITILKDALGKPFDLLASPDPSAHEFLVK
ncbi:OLC1v1026560C1 [Oldenlandia corymbosa var. corymbosa]|uniref:OLC1v1026560C1 n=1 Tax=Oldenlandia corymbosa var. corymbosa TaxID=529605 RepID=A0AAV1C7X4_OLDCO|nr:OLC1v1026560C1 [Oldenlandia corymbosa var. corymbosa]